ncbi:hypothetical protein P3W85_24505 [Cupriavidus basilensis]|uniref:Uncharacterized protein n=1 Tax=Cupriavidus basilensis TaxID=68895 RepID=A0ABT6ATY4_9BURK|nr:hypothetical protein [Cupriavidus basilensis]MDF3836089.1 hypothetical protein [Cupriavidus basilensis]
MKLYEGKFLARMIPAWLVLAGASLCVAPAIAQSTGNMGGSEQVSVGTLSILAAPVASVAGSAGGAGPLQGSALAGFGSVFIVSGIGQGAQDTVELILDAASGAGKVSVKIARSGFEKLGVSVGATVNAVADSTGTLLVASGKVLAFIPNTLGEALLYRERVPSAAKP